MKPLPKIRGRIPTFLNEESILLACMRNHIRLTIQYEKDGFLIHILCLETGNIGEYYSFTKVLRMNSFLVSLLKDEIAQDGKTQHQREKIRKGLRRKPKTWL